MWQVSLFIFHKEDLSYGSQSSAQGKYVGIAKLRLKKTRLPTFLTPQYIFFAFGLGINISIDTDTLFYVVNMLSHTAKTGKKMIF